jgi:hypothetical protein
MARRISTHRIVWLLIAATLIVATLYFAIDYQRKDRDFYECLDARPAAVTVDLSQPGKSTAPFKQTCALAHGEALYLVLPVATLTTQSVAQLLDGLDATITITDTHGNQVIRTKFTDFEVGTSSTDPILLSHFDPFQNGDYVIAIDVAEGAPALLGSKQTVFAKYELCGMERLPATFAAVLSFACGIPGALVAMLVIPGLVKHGIWAPPHDT